MRFRIATLLALGLCTTQCSKAPERVHINPMGAGGENAQPPGTPIGGGQTPDGETSKLALSTLGSDSLTDTFDLAKAVEIHWLNAGEFILATSDGKSVVYNLANESWSSVHTNTSALGASLFIDFRDAGYISIVDGILHIKTPEGSIVSVSQPEDLKNAAPVSAGPGAISFKLADTIKVIKTAENMPSIVEPNDLPEGVQYLSPCNAICSYWGFNGSYIAMFMPDGTWRSYVQPVTFPAEENLGKIGVFFEGTPSAPAIHSIVAQTESGKLLLHTKDAGAVVQLDWPQVQALSNRFCVNCHADDGYDKLDTWKGLKSEIIVRLKAAPDDKAAMPPPATNYGKEMTAGEKSQILAWMEKQEEIDRGEIGGGGGNMPDRNAAIAGDLKTFATPNCTGCHSDANRMGFWIDKKADAISRINSGNMPKGKVMSAGDKDKLLKAIEAIK